MSETTEDLDYSNQAKDVLGYSRWWQVAAAAAMMALVSPYQYVWSAIEGPLAIRLEESLAVIGFVFTMYVIVMSLAQFPAGWYRDRYGPRRLVLFAGVLSGGGYFGTAFATEIWLLYLSYGIGAIGVGIVYTVAVNTAIKWFPDRRGLTTGVGTMAFGGGSALFVPIVRTYSSPDALPNVLAAMGLVIFLGILVGGLVLRDPPSGFAEGVIENGQEPDPDDSETEASQNQSREELAVQEDGGIEKENESEELYSSKQYTWRESIRTWQFWVMYAMFTFVAATGLMITARVVLYAEEVGLTALAATTAATILPLASGGGRLIVGGLSDKMQREQIMAGSFLICGVGTLIIVVFGIFEIGVGYILAVAIAVFFWSSQFSLFPSLVADYYGPKHSSSNYALLYSSKMWGGVFGGGVVGWLVGIVGWNATFVLGGVLALTAGLLGLLLRPPSR